MKLDKKYLLNYIVSAMFIVIAVVFFYNLSAKVFGINLLKTKHLYKILNLIISGKIFTNLKNLSVFISFIGFVFVLIGGCKLSMDIEYQKHNEAENNENTNQTTNTDFTVATEKIEEKNTDKTDENTKNDAKEPEKQENKFAVYDKPKEDKKSEPQIEPAQTVKQEANIDEVKIEIPEEKIKQKTKLEKQPSKQEVDFLLDEEQEREKLKNKIKEMINKMDNNEIKNEDKNEDKEDSNKKLLSKFDMSKIKGAENTDKKENKIEILTAEKIPEKMNYETITEEQNMIFENVLIDAGFKLLSQIRIGQTGIDYLGISKEQIAIIQVDTNEGKWVANEDLIADNQYPLWYSENGNKISPFYRTTETVNTIKSLLKDNEIPVQGYVCLTNNTIVNMEEAEEIAKKQNIKILKIENYEGNEFIDSLDEEFEEESLTEPDQKTLDKIISTLEQAEIPE